jgi:membrane protein implicated in regulation of membrane protease activity
MLNSPSLWLIAGSILCLLELIFPTAFIEFMMGLAAILTAIAALIVPQLSLQVVIWLIISTLLVIISRHWVNRLQSSKHRVIDDREGETLTEILPGETGRVLFEGNSWRAKCADDRMAIASQQKVYIVSRQGNTLFVLPVQLLNASQ